MQEEDRNYVVFSLEMYFSVLHWVLNKITSRPGVDIHLDTFKFTLTTNLDVSLKRIRILYCIVQNSDNSGLIV